MIDNNNENSEFIIDKDRAELDKVIVEAISRGDLAEAKSLISSMHIADQADLIDRLPTEVREILIDILSESLVPELLVEIESSSILESIIAHLGVQKIAKLISKLEIDDAVSVLVDLSEETKDEIISHMSKNKQKELDELFSYPENSAGRIMQKKFVAVPDSWSVGQTIDHMRENENIPNVFYEIFVINTKFKPIGYVPLGLIMHHGRSVLIKDILRDDMRIIDTNLDQEEVSFLFKQYGVISVPVVNKIGRLVGVLTIDDALEVIEKEAEEDIMHMGGVNETDFHLEIFEIVKSRFPWLFINLLTATIAAIVVLIFDSTIQHIVALAAVMQIVASVGGNAGTQTMTVSVVALSTKELSNVNAVRVIIRQITACALNGLLVAIIGGILMAFWYKDIYLSVVFGVSMIINFALAGFFGTSIPILINRLGLDPAIASPIFLTPLTDAFGFLTFLGLATIFLM